MAGEQHMEVNMDNDEHMDDSDLQQMYQEVILQAARDPHGKQHFAQDVTSESQGDIAQTTVRLSHEACTIGQSHQFNPTCGDEATVHVEVSRSDPQTIVGVIWDGHGCSISQASLSVMTDLVSGKTIDEAMRLSELFDQLMKSRGSGLHDEASEDALGDAVVFEGVSQYPMRIKCALLGWAGLKDSVAKALASASSSISPSLSSSTTASSMATATHGSTVGEVSTVRK